MNWIKYLYFLKRTAETRESDIVTSLINISQQYNDSIIDLDRIIQLDQNLKDKNYI